MAAKAADRRGREQRRQTATARARRPNLSSYYGRTLPDITPGEFEFRVELMRGRGVAPLPLDSMLTQFEWSDEEAALSGSVTLQRPDPGDASSLPIGRGHEVRCRLRWAGAWYELWRMRCEPPEVTVETGQVQVALKDDLDLLRRSSRRWLYRATKRQPHGWFGHDALRDAAAKAGVKLGAIARCSARRKKINVHGSFLDLAVDIYSHERQRTGQTFILRMRDGKFEAVSYRRNRTIYELAEQIRTALVKQVPKSQNPPTVLTGRARIGKGKRAKKIRHTEYRRDMVRRFGYVHRDRDYGRVDSIGELRSKVRRDLARYYKVDTTCTVQTQGLPFLRRGDGAEVVVPSEGLKGENRFVYATAVRHQVQAGTYTTEADFTQVDPFEADRAAREKAARARKRRQRKRRKRGSH